MAEDQKGLHVTHDALCIWKGSSHVIYFKVLALAAFSIHNMNFYRSRSPTVLSEGRWRWDRWPWLEARSLGPPPCLPRWQPCWRGHRLRTRWHRGGCEMLLSVPFCLRTKEFPVYPQSLSSGCVSLSQIKHSNQGVSFLVWFAGWFNLFCGVPWSLRGFFSSSIPIHPEQAWGIGGWTWLQFFLLKLALILLNDYTRRISQLYRNGYFFKNIYQLHAHPAGWLWEALWRYLTDTAAPGILQPLHSSFVSHVYWEKK